MTVELNRPPPKISPPVSPGIFAVVVLGATAVGAGTMVFLFNPATHHFYPACLFHALTGWNCPGCGATRALYALLHGNLRLAFKDNALFVVALAAFLAWVPYVIFLKFKKRPATFRLASRWAWMLLAAALVFGVLRNLPGFAWLSP